MTVAADDDLALLGGLRRGEESAFTILLERYQTSLIRLALLYVHDRDAAEDVAQETWLAVLRGVDRFQGRASLKTWLLQILVNRARSRAGRDAHTIAFSTFEATEAAVPEGRFRPPDDPRWPGHWLVAPSAEDLPEERLLASELQDRVRAALAELPLTQREVVTLRDIEGLTGAEVCELLNLSEANQRVILHRGRSRVRGALEAYLARERTSRS